jgi:hypothetical protein
MRAIMTATMNSAPCGLGSFTKAFIQAGVTLMTMLAAGQGGASEAAVEREIHAQPSWILATDDVEVAVTKLGGHMAPVTFDRRGRPFQPYHISPWQDERIEDLPAAVLVPLRGDFFCLPFGGNAGAFQGQQHAPHGETATGAWTLADRGREADGTETLTLTLGTKVRPGTITKRLAVASGQPVVYSTHVIEGFAGPAPLGHHATLAMPEREGAVAVSVSPFKLGMTNPGVFSDPASGEYQALALGATFTDLARVPSLFKSPAEVDCSRFPTRKGYADLLAMVADKAALGGGPAWTAAVNTADGWVWFALRDPDVLPTTVFWIENRGRHGSPWNGRNNCLGLEDVCAFFADGLVPSTQDNALSKQGVRTAVELDATKPTEIRYIQGAARVPAGFDRVKRIDFSKAGQIGLVSDSGQTVTVPVNHAFVFGKRP